MGPQLGSLLVVFGMVCHVTANGFSLDENDTGFTVSINNVLVLQHSSEFPMVYVGNGKADFEEHEGNFHIEERISSKIPVISHETTRDQDNMVVVTLKGYAGDEVILSLSSSQQHPLVVEFVKVPDQYNRIWLRLPATENEAVYGGGEQFTYFNLRGHDFPIWTREQGVGRDKRLPVTYLADAFRNGAGGDYHMTYFPQPTFLSSRHYSCHYGGSNYMHLNFEDEEYHEILIHDIPGNFYFTVDETLKGLVSKLSAYLGRQPPLPDWLHQGVVLGMQGGTKEMLRHLDMAEEAGVKVSGLWIQDWSGKIFTSFGKRVFWNWEWNAEMYPGLDEEIPKLKEKGVRVLGYVTPHLNVEGNLYKHSKGKDYFMKNSTGQTYIMDFGQFFVATVDLTNPEAFEWYKGVITRNMIDLGLGGWMADFAEYNPVDGVYHNGVDGQLMHNRFTALWAQLNREAVEEAGKLGEVMFFMRSGSTGTQANSLLMWAGDQNVDFSYPDGLASTVPAALSMGVCGIGMTHFDIGGYTTMYADESGGPVHVKLNLVRSEELFFRGAEMAMFTPVMRTHEGNIPQLNYQVHNSVENLKKFVPYVNIYRKFQPYRKSLEQEVVNDGLPMQRPLFIHYENDPVTLNIQYQYLFGRDILVAPVLDAGATQWKLYLPRDVWVHIFTGEEYGGGEWITVDSPVGTPPVFYRKGSEFVDLFKNIKSFDDFEDHINDKSEL